MKKLWKRGLALVMVGVMSLSSTYSPVAKLMGNNIGTVEAAVPGVWSGGIDTSWYTGDKDTYEIATAEQLAGFAKLVDDAAHEDRFRGVTINLVSDIVLNDVTDFENWDKKAPANKWEPIGNQGSAIMGYNPFAGNFNGNGHTITGMYSQNLEYGFWGSRSRIGFFECLCGATVSNLNFQYSYVASSGDVGVLAAVTESSYVSGVHTYNSKIISNDGSAGGIVGDCHQFVNTYVMSIIVLALMGFVINPILYGNELMEEVLGNHGSIISDCSVANAEIIRNKQNFNGRSGGIVGGGTVGVCSCAVANVKFRNVDTPAGAIMGQVPEQNGNSLIQNCTYYGCKLKKVKNEKYKTLVDREFVVQTKKDTLIKVGAKKSKLTVKNIKKKAAKIDLKCKTNTTESLMYQVTATPKKGAKYIKVTNSGKVKIKKKAPRGTYVITVYSRENDAYASGEKEVRIKVK